VTDPATLFASVARALASLDGSYFSNVTAACAALHEAFVSGGKVLVFGNGGSATDAQHIAAELVGRFATLDRKALPAIALTTNQAIITAWSNDHSFEDVFARQIEALGRPGDVAWGISTSGNSPNVVKALKRARAIGLTTIGLTGQGGGLVAEHCDVLIAAPLTETPRIQEVHLITYHAICARLEECLFGDQPASS
jgi:D-sedoheptulose 7-phosphate isomerase